MNPERIVFELRTRQNVKGKTEVWDPLRKKFVALTPEEWVRQQFIQHALHKLKLPAALIAVERGITYNGLQKRIDLMVFNRNGNPCILVEFKSPEVSISEKTLMQSALYNHTLGAEYIVLDNFYQTFIFKKDKESGFMPFERLPEGNELN